MYEGSKSPALMMRRSTGIETLSKSKGQES